MLDIYDKMLLKSTVLWWPNCTLLPGVRTRSAPKAFSRMRLSVLMVSGIVRISL